MLCDHSLEGYRTVLSCGAVCFVIQCGCNVLVSGSNYAVLPFFGKLVNSTLMDCGLYVNTRQTSVLDFCLNVVMSVRGR